MFFCKGKKRKISKSTSGVHLNACGLSRTSTFKLKNFSMSQLSFITASLAQADVCRSCLRKIALVVDLWETLDAQCSTAWLSHGPTGCGCEQWFNLFSASTQAA